MAANPTRAVKAKKPAAKRPSAKQTKLCRQCEETKPIGDFYKFAAGEHGVYHLCKEC